MQRVQAGDEGALAVLMERWERPLKSMLARIVLNGAEAEELAQETFVRVWMQRGKFRPEAEFRPWLFAIGINLARNRLRWWRRRPVVALESWMDAPASDHSGARGAEQREQALAVRDAVASLPAPLREAWVLFEYENLSQVAIAAMLGCSRKTVESRVYRARALLRTALADWMS